MGPKNKHLNIYQCDKNYLQWQKLYLRKMFLKCNLIFLGWFTSHYFTCRVYDLFCCQPPKGDQNVLASHFKAHLMWTKVLDTCIRKFHLYSVSAIFLSRRYSWWKNFFVLVYLLLNPSHTYTSAWVSIVVASPVICCCSFSSVFISTVKQRTGSVVPPCGMQKGLVRAECRAKRLWMECMKFDNCLSTLTWQNVQQPMELLYLRLYLHMWHDGTLVY